MPTEYTVPSRRVRHCQPCEHHHCIGSMHVRSGEGGWREYACEHPDAFADMNPENDPKVAALLGKIGALENGRHIGRTENQPDWCPLKREKERP